MRKKLTHIVVVGFGSSSMYIIGISVLVRFGSFQNVDFSSVRSVRIRFYSHLYMEVAASHVAINRNMFGVSSSDML